MKKLLAVDVDDVLVNITPKWVGKALAHPEMKRVGRFPHLPSDRASLRRLVLGRDMYDLPSWLGIPGPMIQEFLLIYANDENFYDDLPPTPMAESVRLSLQLPHITGRVHVISQVMAIGSGGANASKERWLKWLLEPSLNPVSIHFTLPSEKKSDVLRKHCPEPDTFVDDSMKNVLDVLTSKGVSPKQVLLPKMGHNDPAPSISLLAKLSSVDLSYYGTVHNPVEDEGSW